MTTDRVSAAEWLRKQTKKIEPHSDLDKKQQIEASSVQVEAWLQRNNIEYAPPTGIPMEMIDVRRSRQNQARRDPLVQDSVDRYALAFKNGDPFPPIVCYAIGQKLIIIDGNNRQAGAAKAGHKYIYGIVISDRTSSEMIQLLTVEANSTHGVTPPVEWRVKQALALVNLGHSVERAALASNVTALQLKAARAAAEADGRALDLKVYGFSELVMSTKQALNTLRDDPSFKAASILAVGKKLSTQQVQALVREVKQGRSEAEKLQIIRNAADGFDVDAAAKQVNKKGVSNPPQRILAGMGLITNVDPAELVACIRTVHDRDQINARLDIMQNRIFEIQEAMETLKDMDLEEA